MSRFFKDFKESKNEDDIQKHLRPVNVNNSTKMPLLSLKLLQKGSLHASKLVCNLQSSRTTWEASYHHIFLRDGSGRHLWGHMVGGLNKVQVSILEGDTFQEDVIIYLNPIFQLKQRRGTYPNLTI